MECLRRCANTACSASAPFSRKDFAYFIRQTYRLCLHVLDSLCYVLKQAQEIGLCFCVQVMAMGTLALCFDNPRVFTGEWPSPPAISVKRDRLASTGGTCAEDDGFALLLK